MSAWKSPSTLVFDVNETLLDLEALAPLFQKHLGDARLLKRWFSQILLYSQAVTLTGSFADMSTLARHALQMMAQMNGRELSGEAQKEILTAMRSLPAHEDVLPALQRLRDSGFTLVALTNSTQSVVEEQFHVTGLERLFARILSVDGPKKFKPHPDVYRWATLEINTAPGQAMMIAAHPWDLMGARAAGFQVAFVERVYGSWFPLQEKPEISGPTLTDIADQLIGGKA